MAEDRVDNFTSTEEGAAGHAWTYYDELDKPLFNIIGRKPVEDARGDRDRARPTHHQT